MRTTALFTLFCTVCNLYVAYAQEASFVFPNGTTVAESAGSLPVCVQLSQAPLTNIAITINAMTVVNTQEGVNFIDPNSRLDFTPTGPTEQCIDVGILQDNVVTVNSQLFQLMMSTTDTPVTLGQNMFITITDTDVLQVSFTQASYTSQYEEGPVMVCAIIVSGEIGVGNVLIFSARLALEQGSATAGTDYAASITLFEFTRDTVGEVCVPVIIFNDTAVEGTEYFQATLISNLPTSLVIVNGTAMIIITDNDVATVSLQPSELTVLEGNFSTTTTETLCILFEANIDLQRSVVVDILTTEVTASDESDFAPIERNITITSESLQNNRVCFEVTIIGDNINEPDETFRVEISANSPDMVQIGQRQATIRIIHDGDLNLCPTLTSPTNGEVIHNGFNEGAMAMYSCNQNYALRDGAQTRTCQPSGSWSGSEPVCVASCDLLTIGNGRVTSTTSLPYIEGTIVTYICNQGYILDGVTTRTCQSNSMWTGSDSTCNIADCGPLDPPANGTVEHAMTTFQSQATYMCNEGFMLRGDGTRQCLETGSWAGSDPFCSGAKGVMSTGGLLLIITIALSALLVKL